MTNTRTPAGEPPQWWGVYASGLGKTTMALLDEYGSKLVTFSSHQYNNWHAEFNKEHPEWQHDSEYWDELYTHIYHCALGIKQEDDPFTDLQESWS